MVKEGGAGDDYLDSLIKGGYDKFDGVADRLTPDNSYPTTITDTCTVCNKRTKMRYIGTQYRHDVRAFDMYNCPCGATHSYNPSPEWLDHIEEKRVE